MAWNDCDNGGGREDKVSSRDQEEGGHRGCGGTVILVGTGKILGPNPVGFFLGDWRGQPVGGHSLEPG